MSKRVQLTWMPDTQPKCDPPAIEEVMLLDEDENIFGMSDSIDEPIISGKDFMDMMKDFVLFEDETGVFGIRPSQIIEIKLL